MSRNNTQKIAATVLIVIAAVLALGNLAIWLMPRLMGGMMSGMMGGSALSVIGPLLSAVILVILAVLLLRAGNARDGGKQ